MRDDSKTKEYYELIYEQDTNFIIASEERLKKVITVKGPDFRTIPSCYSGISYDYFHRFYLSYTMGKSYEDIISDVRKYVDNGIKGCNGSVYGNLESIIYVTIIFGLGEYKDRIKEKMLQYDDFHDKYMEQIYSYLDPSFEISSELYLWEKECKPLIEVIELSKNDKELAATSLKNFVDKQWFKTLQGGLISNESRTYRGFWCLEAAALVKALKLDDTILKDSKYYPYDMAHFCD